MRTSGRVAGGRPLAAWLAATLVVCSTSPSAVHAQSARSVVSSSQLRLAEAQVARGQLDSAEASFRAAIAARAADESLARAGLGDLLLVRGRRAEALPFLQAAVSTYRGMRTRSRAQTLAAARALRLLGSEDPQSFKSALRAYDEAIAMDSSDLDTRAELGDMFLEKFASGEAKAMFAGVLGADSGHPAALVGEARRRQFDGEPGAAELATRALARDRAYVPALVLLGELALSSEDYPAATERANAALAANPASREALAIHTIARRGAGDGKGYEAARSRLARITPRWSGLPLMQAEHAVRTRRYTDAVTFAREAVKADPRDWRAYAVLGINLLRVGSPRAARDTLEIAFAGDPYDVWTKNTLDLIDTFEQYVEVPSARFVFFLDRKQSDVVGIYAGKLAEEAFDTLAARYRYRPPTPVRVELYRTSADFSVRTVGLPGLGALGVAFGSTLAMDAPGARERGSYNWGSTLWHEIAHAFTLGASGHNVSRWFTEGLSVLEERRARPGWGDSPGPPFFGAYLDGKLLPVSRLNEGFARPSYPEQLGFAYYQASLVVEMIEREFGMQAIRDALLGFRQGLGTSAALERALRIDAATLDKRYDAWFQKRFAATLDAVRRARKSESRAGDTTVWVGMLARGADLAREGKTEAAIAILERAKSAYPDFAGAHSAYRQLARIYTDVGRLREAAAELTAYTAINGNSYDVLIELASLRERTGDRAGAAEALERAIYVFPFEIPVHEKLATIAEQLGRPADALRERQVVLALGPVDRAEAMYRLARAELAAGRRDDARRTVLRALEIAPRFALAQELLLEIAEGGKP